MMYQALITVLTLLSVCHAQSFADPMPDFCLDSCGLSTIMVINQIVNSSVLTLPSSYSQAKIILDQSISFDTLFVTGSNNLISVPPSVTITVRGITVTTSNQVTIQGTVVVSGVVRADGVVTVVGSLVTPSYSQTSSVLIVNSKRGYNGYGLFVGNDLTIAAAAALSVSGSVFAPASVTFPGNLTVLSGGNFTAFNTLVLPSQNNVILGSVAANTITANSLYIVGGSVSSTLLTTSGEVYVDGTVTTGTFTASGNVTVSGTIYVSSSYTQSNSILYLDDGVITSSSATTTSAVTVQTGSTLAGSGNIGTTGYKTSLIVASGSTVDIGYSPGTITVNGDWRQSSDATFNMEVNATAHDMLVVSGTAYPGGKLRCITLGKYVPTDNTQITFISANAISGGFSSVTSVGAPKQWTLQVSGQSIPATVTATYDLTGDIKGSSTATTTSPSVAVLLSAVFLLLAVLL